MKRKLDERLEQIDRYNLPHKFKGGHLPKECSTVAEVGDSVNEYRVNVKEHFPEYYHSHDRGLVLGQEIPELYDLFCKELEKALTRLLPYEVKELTIWLKIFTSNKPELYICMNLIK